MTPLQTFERARDQLRGLGSKSKSLLKPPPIHFGAPRQLAPEPAVSWWHIPVFLEPMSMMHRRVLDACRVYLVAAEGDGQPLPMRWRSIDSPQTAEEIALNARELYFVPVAARKETSQKPTAIVTTARFLAHKRANWAVPAGRSVWRLRIESGEKTWDSAHRYALHVPASTCSNGCFTLEVNYDRFE